MQHTDCIPGKKDSTILYSWRLFGSIDGCQFDQVVGLIRLIIRDSAEHFQEWKFAQKFFPERVVESAVDERIATGGGHGDDVADDEGRVVVLEAVDVEHVKVCHEVDHVERQPRGPEYDDLELML